MTLQEVIDLYSKLDGLGIKVWIDGGWGVDALLGKQTRSHPDLDIAIEQKDLAKLLQFLEPLGYKEVKRDNEWNFVIADNRGLQIDIHVFVSDNQGRVIGGLPYPTESLTGKGTIDGTVVRCISPEWMVKFHSGYELKEKDYQDVSALCEKYGIDLPAEYNKFKK